MPNSNYALWGGRVFIIAALLIGFASIFGFGGYARFHQRVEDLKASGEMLAIEDLCQKVERPEDDAKFYLRKIYESAKEVDRVISLKEDQDESAAGSRTDAEAMAMFARLTDDHPDLFPTITLAAAAPKMSYDLEIEPSAEEDSEPLEDIRSYDSNNEWVIMQKVFQVLDWKCEVQIAQGDFDGAFDSAIELMRLGKLNSQHGPLLHIFLGIAFQRSASFRLAQLSERQSLSAEKRRIVQSLIEDNDLMEAYRRCLQTERSVLTYHIINFGGDGKTWSDNEPVVWLFSQFKSGPAMAVGNQFLDSFQSAIEWSELPLSEEFTADPNNSFTLHKRFGGLRPDSYDRFRLQVGEAVAEIRVLQIVLALDANPDSADRDDWPVEYLTSIGVPESATFDPFDDQPMRIKRTEGEWNVYSIGQNRKDDGGIKFSDISVSPVYLR